MTEWLRRNMKWVVASSMLLVLLAAAPTASAGRRWTGFDPVIDVNGQQLNVWVEWDAEHTCDINGPIQIQVLAPHGSSVLEESEETFDCDGGPLELATSTSIAEFPGRGFKGITLLVTVNGDTRFATRALVYKDGELIRQCQGISNHPFRCAVPRF